MEVIPLAIPDVLLIKPHVLEDARGFFFESFKFIIVTPPTPPP